MTRLLYNNFLNATTFALNLTIKYNLWLLADKLIQLRKKHIIKILKKNLN